MCRFLFHNFNCTLDWSIHRGGAVFATGTEGARFTDVHFTRLAGNALFFSDYCKEPFVGNSEFSWIGDSGLALVGSTRFKISGNKKGTDLMDGSEKNQPRGATISNCIFREIGVFGKQTSGIIQSLAGNTSINACLLFNVGLIWVGAGPVFEGDF